MTGGPDPGGQERSCRGRLLRLFTFMVASGLCLGLLFAGCSWFGGPEEQLPEASGGLPQEPGPVCRLCGRPVSDSSVNHRRPVGVKVSNEPAARPQSGLMDACITYEELTEGAMTRYLALFLCREPEAIGPVRSARPVDIELVAPYQALFAHCGGGRPILEMIRQSGIADVDELVWTGAYWRSSDRRSPHNLYTSAAMIRKAGEAAYPFEGKPDPPFAFLDPGEIEQMAHSPQRPAPGSDDSGNVLPQPVPMDDTGGRPVVVNNVHVPYTGDCAVRWEYDPDSRRFLRFLAGAPHVDAASGLQVFADNLVIQYVIETPSGLVDVLGADTPDLGVVGSGRAQVLVMGQLIEGTWEKSSRHEHTAYLDGRGRQVPFKPGTTWIELVPASREAGLD